MEYTFYLSTETRYPGIYIFLMTHQTHLGNPGHRHIAIAYAHNNYLTGKLSSWTDMIFE